MAAINYVKFMRGTQTFYNNLEIKDQDTLYFVYDNVSDDHGKLYLGNKLISDSSSNSSGEILVSDIQDFLIDENLADGNLLIYDEVENKWVNKPISAIFELPVMTGATSSSPGTEGLVPGSSAGDQNKFLRGDGTWAEVIGTLTPEEQSSLEELSAVIPVLIGEDTGKSIAEIAQEKIEELLIPDDAKEELDTIEEIASWIQSHFDEAEEIGIDIAELQEKVSALEELSDKVEEIVELREKLSDLEDIIGSFTPVEGKYVDISSAISYLDISTLKKDDRLKWCGFDENVD